MDIASNIGSMAGNVYGAVNAGANQELKVSSLLETPKLGASTPAAQLPSLGNYSGKLLGSVTGQESGPLLTKPTFRLRSPLEIYSGLTGRK